MFSPGRSHVGVLVALAVTGFGCQAVAAPLILRSGPATMSITPVGAALGVRLWWQDGKDRRELANAVPLAVEVVGRQEQAGWLTGGYETATRSREGILCHGTLRSRNGTQFHFRDNYRPLGQLAAFKLTRHVEIATPSPADAGFSSRYTLTIVGSAAMRDFDFFTPGVWYGDNRHVPPTALAANLDDNVFYFREDRLPLPLTMLRDRRSGEVLSLAHVDGNPQTLAGEDGLQRIIDARLQFGSIGVTRENSLALSFLFPGSEGERTYIHGASREHRWALRSHPVAVAVPHSYNLVIRVARSPDYAAAVRDTWRAHYALFRPPVLPVDLAAAYKVSIDLLAATCHEYYAKVDLPFLLSMPDGKVPNDGALSGHMGFVGRQLPAAYHLLKYGLDNDKPEDAAHAEALIDFWVNYSLTPAGLPRTWYDLKPDGQRVWRDFYKTYLRVASDGIDGVLQAWNVSRRHGHDRPQWLDYCKRYGDWLVRAQNPDGSYYRMYDFDGRPLELSTDTTDHPISFLIDLYRATGDARYRVTALRAGEFCWRNVHQTYTYVGGTPDNPNVTDKEAGMMALEAFLSLYDATGDHKWLDAASQAAWFSATWVYGWNIPMPPDDPQCDYPRNRTTYGLSLIATGHSGADMFMAGAPFLYYRLYLATGETFFRDLALILMNDTKQLIDWDGTLRYAYHGLQTEALSLAVPRGHSVKVWLPWLTIATIEPMEHLRDVFGSWSIPDIEKLPLVRREQLNAKYSRSHGFMSP